MAQENTPSVPWATQSALARYLHVPYDLGALRAVWRSRYRNTSTAKASTPRRSTETVRDPLTGRVVTVYDERFDWPGESPAWRLAQREALLDRVTRNVVGIYS